MSIDELPKKYRPDSNRNLPVFVPARPWGLPCPSCRMTALPWWLIHKVGLKLQMGLLGFLDCRVCDGGGRLSLQATSQLWGTPMYYMVCKNWIKPQSLPQRVDASKLVEALFPHLWTGDNRISFAYFLYVDSKLFKRELWHVLYAAPSITRPRCEFRVLGAIALQLRTFSSAVSRY